MGYDFSKQYIDGAWVDSTSGAFIDVENPATLEHFARVPQGTKEDIDRAIAAARRALPGWSKTPLSTRIDLMKSMLEHFRASESTVVDLLVKELGAPISFARTKHFGFQTIRTQSYIDLVQTIQFKQKFPNSTVYREPVGVVACVTPWNYPIGQVVQKIVPAVLTGNTVVLKPSQHTPLSVYLMIEAFEKAGFPRGVVNLVSGKGAELGDYLATHPGVDMLSFTGSTRVGKLLAQSSLGSVKRVSLELGGKSPFIWLPGITDYRLAVRKLFDSIFMNTGQTCTALSRLIVPRSELAAIEAVLIEEAARYVVGDTLNESTMIGPLSSRAQFDKVKEYLQVGLEEGARMILGDIPTDCSQGYFVKPVIFSDVNNRMRIAQEEIFGPVLCVIPYETVDEAVAIANDTIYGLSAAVWGPNKCEAITVAKSIRSGNVYVNDGPRDVTAPFGGMKESGLGREAGVAGLLEFTEYKAIFDAGQ